MVSEDVKQHSTSQPSPPPPPPPPPPPTTTTTTTTTATTTTTSMLTKEAVTNSMETGHVKLATSVRYSVSFF